MAGKKKQPDYAGIWEKIKVTDEAKDVCLIATTSIENIEKACEKDPAHCGEMWLNVLKDILPGIWKLKNGNYRGVSYQYLEEHGNIMYRALYDDMDILEAALALLKKTIAERGTPTKIYVMEEKLYESLKKRGFPVEWRQEEK